MGLSLDPMFIVGAVANLAGLVTFLDWAVIKSKARKRKQPLDQSLIALEKLEVSLKGISIAVKEKKDSSEMKHYVDLLYEAKEGLISDLSRLGVEIPQEEEMPKIRGASNETLLALVSRCEGGILRARNELTKT